MKACAVLFVLCASCQLQSSLKTREDSSDDGSLKNKNTMCGMQAFAEAWASGLTCSDYCYVNVEVAAASVGEVLVTAASEAYATACAGAFP